MDFAFNNEQQQLAESIKRYLENEYSFEQRSTRENESRKHTGKIWHAFAEMGLLGVSIPESHGGFGGSAVDTAMVMEVFGRNLVVEPYISTVLLCGSILTDVGTDKQQHELLPAIADGSLLLALAHTEPPARYMLSHVEATARREDGKFVLDGRKNIVLHGDTANKLIVSARESGAAGDERGISLFVVDSNSPGVSMVNYATIDGMRACDVELRGVVLPAENRLGSPELAFDAIARAIDFAIMGVCWEAVGAMAALLDATVEYAKTRKQFGVSIGTFQVLQHRMVDMFIQLEHARSAAWLATNKVRLRDSEERSAAISTAKAQIGESGVFVGQQAIQVHGGIGMSNELKVAHYFKRLTVIEQSFGNRRHHLAALTRVPSVREQMFQ